MSYLTRCCSLRNGRIPRVRGFSKGAVMQRSAPLSSLAAVDPADTYLLQFDGGLRAGGSNTLAALQRYPGLGPTLAASPAAGVSASASSSAGLGPAKRTATGTAAGTAAGTADWTRAGDGLVTCSAILTRLPPHIQSLFHTNTSGDGVSAATAASSSAWWRAQASVAHSLLCDASETSKRSSKRGSGAEAEAAAAADAEWRSRLVWAEAGVCASLRGSVCSSNTAEYLGLLQGLAASTALGIQRLLVRGDSQLVILQVNGSYATHAPHLQRFRAAATTLLQSVPLSLLSHCRRHLNADADALARAAADAAITTATASTTSAAAAGMGKCSWYGGVLDVVQHRGAAVPVVALQPQLYLQPWLHSAAAAAPAQTAVQLPSLTWWQQHDHHQQLQQQRQQPQQLQVSASKQPASASSTASTASSKPTLALLAALAPLGECKLPQLPAAAPAPVDSSRRQVALVAAAAASRCGRWYGVAVAPLPPAAVPSSGKVAKVATPVSINTLQAATLQQAVETAATVSRTRARARAPARACASARSSSSPRQWASNATKGYLAVLAALAQVGAVPEQADINIIITDATSAKQIGSQYTCSKPHLKVLLSAVRAAEAQVQAAVNGTSSSGSGHCSCRVMTVADAAAADSGDKGKRVKAAYRLVKARATAAAEAAAAAASGAAPKS